MIHRADRWWNPSRTLSISPVATQLLMLFKSTNRATDLYIVPQARTVDPILSIILATITRLLRYFYRFF